MSVPWPKSMRCNLRYDKSSIYNPAAQECDATKASQRTLVGLKKTIL